MRDGNFHRQAIGNPDPLRSPIPRNDPALQEIDRADEISHEWTAGIGIKLGGPPICSRRPLFIHGNPVRHRRAPPPGRGSRRRR